jgi:hypothetical protein
VDILEKVAKDRNYLPRAANAKPKYEVRTTLDPTLAACHLLSLDTQHLAVVAGALHICSCMSAQLMPAHKKDSAL